MQVEGAGSTVGLPRDGPVVPFAAKQVSASRDHPPGRFADKVRMAKEKFKVGDLFEAVLSQTFVEPCPAPPSELFRRTRVRNPAPFGFLMNLGSNEYLVGASPEMYVRVQARRVETCPISGTIKRGDDAIADAGQILELLSVRIGAMRRKSTPGVRVACVCGTGAWGGRGCFGFPRQDPHD